jgi:hypothetical protein
VTVTAWSGLHPKQQRHPGHGTRGPRPIVRGTVIRVRVQRVPAMTRPPKVLWLWWAGPEGLQLDLDLAWRAYIRRFDLEHTVRFWKQTLGWTLPRPRHPAQADRWTWLVLAASTQLRLAREVAGDQRLPWERPRPPARLSPLRSAGGSATAGRARLAGESTEILRALPRPAQGPALRACRALPSDQEAHHQAPQEAAHDREGRLTSPARSSPPLTSVDGSPACPKELNHKVRHERGRELYVGRVPGCDAVRKMKVWPFGAALRGEASNHHMPRRSRPFVVSDVETAPVEASGGDQEDDRCRRVVI